MSLVIPATQRPDMCSADAMQILKCRKNLLFNFKKATSVLLTADDRAF